MRGRVVFRTILLAIICAGFMGAGPAMGAQNAMGHYFPGAMASFMDEAPPGLAVLNLFDYYNGTASVETPLPIGGVIAANVDATIYADGVFVGYKTPFGILDGRFAFGCMIPYMWVDIKGTIKTPIGGIRAEDTASGVGDMLLVPFWLTWHKEDFKWDVALNVYAPTGEFDKDKLASTGMNYWTFEPRASVSYLSSKIGLEMTAFVGLDFNTRNADIDYQSGDMVHLEITAAEHLPLFGHGVMGVGANFFYWDQFTGDSGSGALLGSFEGRTLGVGPVVSYVSPPICGHTLLAEVKWLPELNVENRLEGDYVMFKVAWAF